jgi:ABC-type branched-subunit amino acid transport system ATPase component
MKTAIIDVQGLTKCFGGVVANRAVTLHVESRSITDLIGPNGSGKTTLFNSIVGFHPIPAGGTSFSRRLRCGPGTAVTHRVLAACPTRRRPGAWRVPVPASPECAGKA